MACSSMGFAEPEWVYAGLCPCFKPSKHNVLYYLAAKRTIHNDPCSVKHDPDAASGKFADDPPLRVSNKLK